METTDRFGGRYVQPELIGEGGMGRVFRAHDTLRDAMVAIKELSLRHVDSPGLRRRFEHEFRVMRRLRHPNTVEVCDFGRTGDGVPYIVMEHVEGPLLAEVPPMAPDRVAEVLAQLCQALAYIHSRLYVHCDLKPSNVKVLPDGAVKLLDYGLMRQVGVAAPRSMAGTPYYVAPEAIAGGILEPGTDLYSLGVIAFELLTGERPFTGARSEILRQHLEAPAPDPAARDDELPPSLGRLVRQLLAKRPSQRPRSAAAVLAELRHLLPDARTVEETPRQQQGYFFAGELVGRERELEQIGELLQGLPRSSAALFYSAPAGIGKTRLLGELKARAELAGIPTLWLDAQACGSTVHAWTAELLRQLVPLSSESELRAHGPPLAGLCSDLRARLGGDRDGVPDDDAVADEVVPWLAARTERTAVALLLDDVQWMDPKSVAVLNALIRRRDELRVLVAAAFRSDEVGRTSPLFHTVDEGLTPVVELSGLSRRQTRTLLDSLLHPAGASPQLLDLVFERGGGNVFDMIELLRFMVAEGHLSRSGGRWLEPVDLAAVDVPASVQQRLAARLSRLDRGARDLAAALAVLADAFDPRLWQRLSRLDDEAYVAALHQLMRQQIVVKVGPGRYQFSHARLRDAVAGSTPPADRAELHRRVAEALAGRLAEHPRLLSTVARHFHEADAATEAIDYALRAADAAEAAGAEWDAFDHLRHAAARLEAGEGEAEGREQRLVQIYERVADYSAAAWTDAATCLRWLQTAIEHHRARGEGDRAFGLSLAYVVNCAITSRFDEARARVEAILSGGQVAPDSLEWAVLYGVGVCLLDWYQGFQEDCLSHAEAALAIFAREEAALPDDIWPAYSWATFWREKGRAYTGRPIDMDNIELNHRRIDQGRCDLPIYWHTLTAVGARAAFSGRWDDLLAWKQLASRLSARMGKIYWFECWISHSYLYGAIHHGELGQLEHHVEQVRASPDPYQVRLSHLFDGALALARGRAADAVAPLERFMELERACPDNSLLEGHLHLARALIASGELQRAGAEAARGWDLAGAGPYRNPLYRQQFLQLQVELALAHEAAPDLALQRGRLEQALALAVDELDNPLQAGYTEQLWGQLALRVGDEEGARAHLARARDHMLSIGNSYQAGRMLRQLDRLGSAPARTAGADRGPRLSAQLPTEVGDDGVRTQAETTTPPADEPPRPGARPDAPTETGGDETHTEPEGQDHR